MVTFAGPLILQLFLPLAARRAVLFEIETATPRHSCNRRREVPRRRSSRGDSPVIKYGKSGWKGEQTSDPPTTCFPDPSNVERSLFLSSIPTRETWTGSRIANGRTSPGWLAFFDRLLHDDSLRLRSRRRKYFNIRAHRCGGESRASHRETTCALCRLSRARINNSN
jgi:hypothetical protein